MNQEDLKNLTGWLQAIYKESQAARGGVNEMRSKVDMIPEIREFTNRGNHNSSDADRKIEETRNHLEQQIRKVEDMLHEMQKSLHDISSKIDHLK